jgi:hypothetical protein
LNERNNHNEEHELQRRDAIASFGDYARQRKRGGKEMHINPSSIASNSFLTTLNNSSA